LYTGTTPEQRSGFEKFLKEQGYIIAPVTIDADDWKFNHQLINNQNNKEK